MNRLSPLHRKALLLMAAALLAACGPSSPPASEHGSAAASDTDEGTTGPHGGRLLRDGDFALEVTIFERGTPPEFRLYPSLAGKPVAPTAVEATVTLARINGLPGGVSETQRFRAQADHLIGSAEVYEPHSFEVRVSARHDGRLHEWSYDSPEGRVTIAADMAKAAGMQFGTAAAGELHETLPLYGRIQADPERQRAVTARFPGIVRSVGVQVGDAVRQGQLLARIESNESLQVYALTAPIAGTLTARHTNPGESAGSEPLFEIADYSVLRAELNVFPRDRGRLRPGQAVTVTAADGGASATALLVSIAPGADAQPSLSARVRLDNADGRWTPGQFVNASVTVGTRPVPLLVPAAALQSFRDWDVVFANDGERYQALPVTLGRRDDERVEVLDGLTPGARIVVGNSWLVKADIEKSGAAHDH